MKSMNKLLIAVLCVSFLCAFLLFPFNAHAAKSCTLIVSYPEGEIIKQDGDCEQRRSPVSSFKLPLAVMGFDSGLLKDAHTPSLTYKDEYQSDMDIQKKTTDPTVWLKESIVWYSQQLTRKMGAETFKDYINTFNYGNMDVAGNAGKNDGLTQSWLMSSLLISPQEQVVFIKKLLECDLGVSEAACAATIAITPEFQAGEWKVFGKTGSGWLKDDKGNIDKSKPQGWFVGWAIKNQKKVIFAKLVLEDRPSKEYGGPKAREAFLKELSSIK